VNVSPVCRKRCAHFKTLALLAVAIVSTGCCSSRADAVHSIAAPPRASESVRRELHELEGTNVCEPTRDFLLEEVAPYFESVRAALEDR